MKKNIDYELVREEFEYCCLKILEETIDEFEQKAFQIPIETFVHNREFTTKPVEPAQKRLDRDCRFMTTELSKPGYGELIEQDGVAGRLAWWVWEKRENLEIFRFKENETRRKYFIELVIMIYERGRNRYLDDQEKRTYEEALNILWNYFNDIIVEVRELTKEEEYALKNHFLVMDCIDFINYNEMNLNDYRIIGDSCTVVTEWALQKCFEIYCQNKKSIPQLLEEFIVAEEIGSCDIDINNEYRRFGKYCKKYLENFYKYGRESLYVQIPYTKIKVIKLLYLASLNNKMLNNSPLGLKRKIFAKEFIKEIFGMEDETEKYIEQVRILLALSGYFKIEAKLLKKADYKMIDSIVDYLDFPIKIDGKDVAASNEIVDNWIYIRCVADRLVWVSGGKALSKSRKEKMLGYVKKLDEIDVFHIKLQYFQTAEKFVSSLTEDSWLRQQVNVLKACSLTTLLKFKEKCEIISKDTKENKDDIILKTVNYDFKSARIYKKDYHTLSTKYLKTVMDFMLLLHDYKI